MAYPSPDTCVGFSFNSSDTASGLLVAPQRLVNVLHKCPHFLGDPTDPSLATGFTASAANTFHPFIFVHNMLILFYL